MIPNLKSSTSIIYVSTKVSINVISASFPMFRNKLKPVNAANIESMPSNVSIYIELSVYVDRIQSSPKNSSIDELVSSIQRYP